MKLSELTEGLKCKTIGGDVEITDLKYDSRKVKAGDLFFSITGYETDGHRYIEQAIKSGAVAVVVTEEQPPLGITQVVVKDGRETMSLMAQKFFGYPARQMKTVGITGTNGKTTVTYMIKAIAERSGIKTGLIGTITNMVGSEKVATERTTPEAIDLQRLLRRMVDEGCKLLVMEVSSHSLYLKRVYGMDFDVGVFTNLTQDHLDFHETWQQYVQAKSILFEQSEVSVINVDDDSAAAMAGVAKSEVVRYSAIHPEQYYARNISFTIEDTRYELLYGDTKLNILVKIPGMFTVYNTLAAAAAADVLGIDSYYIELALKEMKPVAGRFEVLDTRGQGYTVILDYAHTPDSMKSTLSTIRSFAPGRVVTVFGCGGNRDASKRPIMAHIAGEYSDFAIITSDNPRHEDPMDIIAQAEEGIKDIGTDYTCIENRREAIKYALENAQTNDIILLAGKGHETYQEIKDKKHDFDEKVVVQELLDELGIKKKEG